MMVGDESSGSTKDTKIENNIGMIKSESDQTKADNGEKIPGIGRTETPNPEEEENKKLQKKKKPIECEDIRNDTLLKISEENSHRKNEVTSDNDTLLKELYKLMANGSRALIAGNARVAVKNYQETFDKLPKLPSNAFNDWRDYIWLKYAFFISLIEVNNYADLLNGLKLLQDLKKSLFSDIPTYHYAVVKILIKLYRFRLAEAEIQKCHDSIRDHTFKNQFWPGTDEVIKETTRDGLENYLQELSAICSCYHLPDAICKFGGCLSASTHPYPSREIFLSDADFKGYIVITCQEGCKIQYHPLCWKNVKDSFSNLDKLSDKDCLGKPCLTPDCKNIYNEPSVILKIEIIGSDGNVKSQCMQDPVAEHKQKEIAIKKRQRLKSDEHKIDKVPNKSKQRLKKVSQPDRCQTSDGIAASMKNPPLKENKSLQICGITPARPNIAVKNKESRFLKMNYSVGEKEFICTYFLTLLNRMGPLSKEMVEEEWERFYPNYKPMSGLVPKSSGIFNLLKNSPNFVMLDNLLCIKESAVPAAREDNVFGVSTNKNVTNTRVVENEQSWVKENALLDSEIREIETELLTNSLCKTNFSHSPGNSDVMPSHSLDSIKQITMMDEERAVTMTNPHNSMFGRPFYFGFFDEVKAEDNRHPIPNKKQYNVAEFELNKNSESCILSEFIPVLEDFLPVPPPAQWRDEGIETCKSVGDLDSAFNHLAIKPSKIIDTHSFFEPLNRKDICTQTDANWENKSSNDDEMWVQHMQLAVNDLVKKNKDLVKSKEDMMHEHEEEVAALKNQMKTLRNSYEEYIKSMKENLNRNVDDDRRRMIALEQRMKLQEQILQSTKEELRKKDFDLLEIKRSLGTAVLERIERESNRQVHRLVTALASLPCNNSDADAVGRAMAKWELTGEQASKAKAEFLRSCTRHQAKLIDGFGTDSLQELVIPSVEEPSGPCPLDNLTITLLQDKENSGSNFQKAQTSVPAEVQTFRSRTSAQIVAAVPVSTPLSPASLGARPREAANGDIPTTLRSWPSTSSIQNSTHSSSTGTARALTSFALLLIELRRCYPSRSEEELCSAVKAVRKKNKFTLSGLTIERIVGMVGNVLEWWPEPAEGSMGLDKFMGWASDSVPVGDDAFHGASKVVKTPAWVNNNLHAKREGEKDDCCICLQGMSEPKTELVCLHSFHTQCIRQWLSKESVCPICRKFTRMPDEFPTLK